jgi:hypothetical protein
MIIPSLVNIFIIILTLLKIPTQEIPCRFFPTVPEPLGPCVAHLGGLIKLELLDHGLPRGCVKGYRLPETPRSLLERVFVRQFRIGQVLRDLVRLRAWLEGDLQLLFE